MPSLLNNSETPPHILVIDDDFAIRTLLVEFLESNGFLAKAAGSAAEGRLLLDLHKFDVIILDIMMPAESGIEFLQKLRQINDTPVLMLSARDQLDDKLQGLNDGADDYMTKPFEPQELIARIKSMLRRIAPTPKITDDIQIRDFTFTRSNGQLSYRNEPVILTSTELLVLRVLMQRLNEPISRATLAQKIGHCVSERSIDVQINRLRQKLKVFDPNVELIQTIRHQGYSLITV